MQHRQLDEQGVKRAARILARRDPDFALIFKSYGPPPLWARTPNFSTLIQIILEQQVSLASAASIYRRMRQHIVPFNAARMIELGDGHLKSLGLTRQKTAYCLHLSQCITDKSLSLTRLKRMPDDDVRQALMNVKGLGSWSADVFLLMALLRPDVWPGSDLALATAVKNLKKLETRPTPLELIAMAEAWRPYRSVAARMLWQYYLAVGPRASRPQ